MSASRVVEKILKSLIDDFENIVYVIEESKDLLTLSVEEFDTSLEVHEQQSRKKKWELQAKLVMKGEAQNTHGRGGRGKWSGGR